jgi:hypothetical protein
MADRSQLEFHNGLFRAELNVQVIASTKTHVRRPKQALQSKMPCVLL